MLCLMTLQRDLCSLRLHRIGSSFQIVNRGYDLINSCQIMVECSLLTCNLIHFGDYKIENIVSKLDIKNTSSTSIFSKNFFEVALGQSDNDEI